MPLPQLHELSLVIGAAFGLALIFCIWFIRSEIKSAINPPPCEICNSHLHITADHEEH